MLTMSIVCWVFGAFTIGSNFFLTLPLFAPLWICAILLMKAK